MIQVWQILLLGIVQGFAELLPVSSSAHVIVVEKWLGIDPTTPQMTFLLVMLHTGTMFSVLFFFWKRWSSLYRYWKELLLATLATFFLAFCLKLLIGEVETLFGNLPMIAGALAAAGCVILLGDRLDKRIQNKKEIKPKDALWIGLIQGVCVPFRGFSRSGATISIGLIRGLNRKFSEEFSFALAVILTPAAIAHQAHRLSKNHLGFSLELLKPGLFGMVLSFLAGLVALKWLSKWLEEGSWNKFGIYCFIFSAFVLFTHFYS